MITKGLCAAAARCWGVVVGFCEIWQTQGENKAKTSERQTLHEVDANRKSYAPFTTQTGQNAHTAMCCARTHAGMFTHLAPDMICARANQTNTQPDDQAHAPSGHSRLFVFRANNPRQKGRVFGASICPISPWSSQTPSMATDKPRGRSITKTSANRPITQTQTNSFFLKHTAKHEAWGVPNKMTYAHRESLGLHQLVVFGQTIILPGRKHHTQNYKLHSFCGVGQGNHIWELIKFCLVFVGGGPISLQ